VKDSRQCELIFNKRPHHVVHKTALTRYMTVKGGISKKGIREYHANLEMIILSVEL